MILLHWFGFEMKSQRQKTIRRKLFIFQRSHHIQHLWKKVYVSISDVCKSGFGICMYDDEMTFGMPCPTRQAFQQLSLHWIRIHFLHTVCVLNALSLLFAGAPWFNGDLTLKTRETLMTLSAMQPLLYTLCDSYWLTRVVAVVVR